MTTTATNDVPLVEAAARLKEGYQATWNRCMRGELGAVRRRGRWFVDSAELEKLVRERNAQRPAA